VGLGLRARTALVRFRLALGCRRRRRHDIGRVARHGHVRRNVLRDDRASTHRRPLADGDVTEQGRVRADRHAVLDGRVPFLPTHRRPAERDAVVDEHVVADLGRLADDDPGAVVDEQPLADGRGRVNFDAGQEAGELRQRPRREPVVPVPEDVGDAIQPDGVDAGIEQCYLQCALGCGVFGESCPDIFQDVRAYRVESFEHCIVGGSFRGEGGFSRV